MMNLVCDSKSYKVSHEKMYDSYLVCTLAEGRSQNERLQLAADNSACIPLADIQTTAGWIKVNAVWTV